MSNDVNTLEAGGVKAQLWLHHRRHIGIELLTIVSE